MCKCSWQDWSSLCFTDVDLWRTKLRILDGVVYNFFSTSPPPSVTKRVKKGTRKKVMREVMLVVGRSGRFNVWTDQGARESEAQNQVFPGDEPVRGYLRARESAMRTAWSGFDRAVAEGDQEAYTATTSRFVSYKIEFARTFEEDE